MARTPTTVWSRLSQMSWDELGTRLRQETGKRLDWISYRLGMSSAGNHFRTAAAGNFFFSLADLPERVRLIKQHLPDEVELIIAEADEICRHRFRLLGYSDLDYGAEIDWHLDAVHQKRAPLIPWYKINFLDFSVAGDHKITWELNRHQHLVTLAKAWRFTGDKKYVQEAAAQWHSWKNANPYPLGINWASSLEVAFRSISWLWLRQLLSTCGAPPIDFDSDLLRALALSGHHMERYLSTYFSPNTHLLGEALALFFLGILCPEIPASEKWKRNGWRILLDESQRQVRPDGVYFEQSLYYHVYALDFFLHARILASRNGIPVPENFDDVMRRMLAVVQGLSQAGPPDGFGDDDGGRLFNPRRNHAEHMLDPLAVGAVLYPSVTNRAPVTEEAIWLFGQEAVAAESPVRNESAPSQSFSVSGLYLLANDRPGLQQMVVDAGPQGTGRSGHGHADALSVKLAFDGRNWLVDAGTCVYINSGSNDDRQQFRGTRAHNTLSVDGLDQAQPEGPFAWSSLPVTQAECWIPAENFTFFAASHSGYERLPQPVRHRRFIFHLHGNFWLIRDVAEGAGNHSLETSWHFAPDLSLTAREGSFLVSVRDFSANAKHLTVLPTTDRRWRWAISTGEVSPAYGVHVPAPVLRSCAAINLPASNAVLLFPQARSAGRFWPLASEDNSANSYIYDWDDASHHFVFRNSKSVSWVAAPWSSDSDFLYYRLRDRKLIHLLFCNATFVRLRDQKVFAAPTPLQYLEWTAESKQSRVFSSANAPDFLNDNLLKEEFAV